MFDDKGELRVAGCKLVLRNKFQVERPTRFVPEPDITIIDGCAIFCGLFIGQKMEQFKTL